VFEQAKLSTAVFTIRKGQTADGEPSFTSRIHPANKIEPDSPSLRLSTSSIPLYDPANFTIVSCSQADWDLATRIMQTGRLTRLGEFAESFQGEVNETTDRKKGNISYSSQDGPEVIRGAHVCLYTTRSASQGEAVYLLVDRYLNRGDASRDQKAFHHQHARIGFQRKSPQNNFRRLVATPIDTGRFLLESVSYFPAHRCQIPCQSS
jgi:hypothetical protein